MSYTNSEQVRHHLIVPYPVQDVITDQRMILSGTDYQNFYGGAITASSLLVKAIATGTPERVTVNMSGGSGSIGVSPLVPGSVAVASDSSGGTIYDENVDYVIDYADGSISIKAGGALSGDQSLVVWYLPYSLYSEGTDFLVDSERGRVKRQASGDIADGETVYLDYTPVYLSVADAIIDNAITLANGMVAEEIDPDGQFEVHPTLGAAATYRALEIVCRAAASRELALQSGGDKAAIVWMKLADVYSARSELLLRSFRPAVDSPRNPSHT